MFKTLKLIKKLLLNEGQQEDVIRIVRRDFGADKEAEILEILNEYDSSEHHRVHLAALKLSKGSVKELRELIELAHVDYRDVISPAEYPNRSRHFSGYYQKSDEERRKIKEQDQVQYDEWLNAS